MKKQIVFIFILLLIVISVNAKVTQVWGKDNINNSWADSFGNFWMRNITADLLNRISLNTSTSGTTEIFDICLGGSGSDCSFVNKTGFQLTTSTILWFVEEFDRLIIYTNQSGIIFNQTVTIDAGLNITENLTVKGTIGNDTHRYTWEELNRTGGGAVGNFISNGSREKAFLGELAIGKEISNSTLDVNGTTYSKGFLSLGEELLKDPGCNDAGAWDLNPDGKWIINDDGNSACQHKTAGRFFNESDPFLLEFAAYLVQANVTKLLGSTQLDIEMCGQTTSIHSVRFHEFIIYCDDIGQNFTVISGGGTTNISSFSVRRIFPLKASDAFLGHTIVRNLTVINNTVFKGEVTAEAGFNVNKVFTTLVNITGEDGIDDSISVEKYFFYAIGGTPLDSDGGKAPPGSGFSLIASDGAFSETGGGGETGDGANGTLQVGYFGGTGLPGEGEDPNGSMGVLLINPEFGGILIGTRDQSKVNKSDILYVDGVARALEWVTVSDRSLKRETSIVKQNTNRTLWKWYSTYDYPTMEWIRTKENREICDEKGCAIKEVNITKRIITGYETIVSDRFTYGLMADEINPDYVSNIGGVSSINYGSVSADNYVEIGELKQKVTILEEDNQMFKDELCNSKQFWYWCDQAFNSSICDYLTPYSWCEK